MTKRQWFLVAGTALLAAACNPLNGLEACPQVTADTDETFCYARSTTEPAATPAPTVETPDSENPN